MVLSVSTVIAPANRLLEFFGEPRELDRREPCIRVVRQLIEPLLDQLTNIGLNSAVFTRGDWHQRGARASKFREGQMSAENRDGIEQVACRHVRHPKVAGYAGSHRQNIGESQVLSRGGFHMLIQPPAPVAGTRTKAASLNERPLRSGAPGRRGNWEAEQSGKPGFASLGGTYRGYHESARQKPLIYQSSKYPNWIRAKSEAVSLLDEL